MTVVDGCEFEISVGGSAWQPLVGTGSYAFGGDEGALRLRGKSSTGTAESNSKCSKISFGDETISVACSGDIRTLVDWENYDEANTAEARFCYMFRGCTSLTTAPALPATELAEGCYQNMFYGCTQLSRITMLATDISALNCLSNWVSGVASTGTFTKAADVTISEDASGIPSGWTVDEQ